MENAENECPTLEPLRGDGNFVAEKNADYVRGLLKESGVDFDGLSAEALNGFVSQFRILVRESDAIIAPKRKGDALLRTMTLGQPGIADKIVDESILPGADFTNKSVLIVDDSIKTGDRIKDIAAQLAAANAAQQRACVLIGIEDGVESLRQELDGIRITCPYIVPEDLFSEVFFLYIVPVLRTLFFGFNSDHPSACFTVTKPLLDKESSVADILTILGDLDNVEAVEESPAVTVESVNRKGFTIRLRQEHLEAQGLGIAAGLKPNTTKIRLYITVGSEIIVDAFCVGSETPPNLCSAGDEPPAAYDEMKQRVLAPVMTALRNDLVREGYTVRDLDYST